MCKKKVVLWFGVSWVARLKQSVSCRNQDICARFVWPGYPPPFTSISIRKCLLMKPLSVHHCRFSIDFNCVVLVLCELTFVQSDTFLYQRYSLHCTGKKSRAQFNIAAVAARSFWAFFRYLASPCGPQLFRAHCPCRSSNGRDYSIGMHHSSATNICGSRTMVSVSPTPPCLSPTLYVVPQCVMLPSIAKYCVVCSVLHFCVLPQSVCLGWSYSPLCYTAPAQGKVWQNMLVLASPPGAQHRSLLSSLSPPSSSVISIIIHPMYFHPS